MATGLLDRLRLALEEASQTPRGQKALHGHDEDFELEVAGVGAFWLAFGGGRLEISDGPSARRQPLRYSLVQLDEPTLNSILAGRISPVEAMEAGKLFLRTRLYGGALITILLRAAYDLARERAIRNQLEEKVG